MRKPLYISVAGIIAGGKTTAAKFLADRLELELIIENFAENTFLPKFYTDMKRWAFHSQTFFLTEKIKQMVTLTDLLTQKKIRGIIQDSPIQQDVYAYGKAQLALKNMTNDEWKLYSQIYELFQNHLPKPDLIVYLEASTENVLMRIMTRGRKFEQDITAEYIDTLQRLNQAWIEKTDIPVVRIDTNVLNIVRKKEDQERLVGMVRKQLNIV